MEYVYSAMVLHAARKPVTEEGITAILKAAGVTADASRVKALTAALEGVDIDKAIATAVAAPVAAAPAEEGREERGEEERGKGSYRGRGRRRSQRALRVIRHPLFFKPLLESSYSELESTRTDASKRSSEASVSLRSARASC
jgi:large subunit ribosomal protein L12